MNEQEQFWAGEFGDAYTQRNRVDWRARVPFWREMIDRTGARSVYEVGCGAGWNLSAIKRAYPDVNVQGCDINTLAIEQADAALNAILDRKLLEYPIRAELVFTAGVLIHVAPENLGRFMERIANHSSDYVLAVEYDSESGNEEPVVYRGHKDRLWRRDYGRFYSEMGLEFCAKGGAGKEFDDCTWWLFRHPIKREEDRSGERREL